MGDRFTPTTCFPPAVDACTVVGPVKKLTRLARIPVSVACGDNQASFADPQSSILINVVTGGQISVSVPDLPRPQTLDLRPFLSGGYLLVGAGLCGGRSYRALHDSVQQIGELSSVWR